MRELISWQRNGGRLRVAVLAHRAAARGSDIRFADGGYGLPGGLARAAAALGLAGSSAADDGRRVTPPRIALFAGAAIGYPYYAYFAHCLLSLGLPYSHADAAALAGGVLDKVDLLVIPGGFATWGLDRSEDRPGLDKAVEDFVARGGAVIGSCGGAFYISQGRPGWMGLIDAKPKYTHEYLQTGAAVVNVRIAHAGLGAGLPDLVEMPYYHGPAYADPPKEAETLAVFDSLALPSRLFIDNPLERQIFEQDLKDRPAVLLASRAKGRAVAFSSHPEMGDFVRKGIALDGYVRKYLPIRGEKIMRPCASMPPRTASPSASSSTPSSAWVCLRTSGR